MDTWSPDLLKPSLATFERQVVTLPWSAGLLYVKLGIYYPYYTMWME